jgi:O-methyltransferase
MLLPELMPLLQKLKQHIRQGTLKDAVLGRFGVAPEYVNVHWHGADNPGQATRVLAKVARIFKANAKADAWVLSLGDNGAFHQMLNKRLRREGVRFQTATQEEILGWQAKQSGGLIAVLCAYPDARRMTKAARIIARHPVLSGIPFEYVNGLDREEQVFARLDEYPDTVFVSPALLDDPAPYALYEESLANFEQKCGLRDFLDLYQLLKSIIENNVPGDIAEFGSFRGHSGYLIARTLQALGSKKRLYMFDTFEEFPSETLGVDHFWNKSHHVDFENVRSKFINFDNVTLVKGDFTQTLASSGLGPVALAYVDCDSYRATRYLFDALLPEKLSPRGVLACEDYGHPALLGNRAAVHESLDGCPGLFRFFSQFSGLYVVVKY